MKNTTISLLLVLFVSACSHKTASTTVTSTSADIPQYSILAADVDSTSVETRTNGTSALLTRVYVEFSAAKAADMKKFGHDHLNQTVQFLIGTNIVSTIGIGGEFSGTSIAFDFTTSEEANRIIDYLAKKP